MLDAYARLNQPDKVIETAGEALQADPKNLQALALAMVNVQRIPKPTPEQLAIGEQAANGLLANADALFAADKKPPAAKTRIGRRPPRSGDLGAYHARDGWAYSKHLTRLPKTLRQSLN
jgi:hypothetical protein